MPMRVSGDLQSANLNSMLDAYLPLHLAGPSELKMHLDASGEALHPRDMTAEVEVERLATSYGGIAVTNEGAIRLRIEHEVMRVEQFRLSGEQGTRFVQVQGEVAAGRQARDRPARRRQREPEAAGDHQSEADGGRRGEPESAGDRDPGAALDARTAAGAGRLASATSIFPMG